MAGKRSIRLIVAASSVMAAFTAGATPAAARVEDLAVNGAVSIEVHGDLGACFNVFFSSGVGAWQVEMEQNARGITYAGVPDSAVQSPNRWGVTGTDFRLCVAGLDMPQTGVGIYAIAGYGMGNDSAVLVASRVECVLIGDFLTCNPQQPISLQVPIGSGGPGEEEALQNRVDRLIDRMSAT